MAITDAVILGQLALHE